MDHKHSPGLEDAGVGGIAATHTGRLIPLARFRTDGADGARETRRSAQRR